MTYLRLDRRLKAPFILALRWHDWWNLASLTLYPSPLFTSYLLAGHFPAQFWWPHTHLPPHQPPELFLERCVSWESSYSWFQTWLPLLVSRSSSSADWPRDSPASQLWGPLFMITGWGGGQGWEEGVPSGSSRFPAISLPCPVVDCCALVNCLGTPDLVIVFHLEFFFHWLFYPLHLLFFFKGELAFASH